MKTPKLILTSLFTSIFVIGCAHRDKGLLPGDIVIGGKTAVVRDGAGNKYYVVFDKKRGTLVLSKPAQINLTGPTVVLEVSDLLK